MILGTIVCENDNKTNYVNCFHYIRSSLVFGEDKNEDTVYFSCFFTVLTVAIVLISQWLVHVSFTINWFP